MKILLVSQMYPGPDDPDLGVFVAQLETQLVARGHEIERAVVDRRDGGKLRHLQLARDARRTAKAFEPDVVYAHFLVPAGLAAALASRAPLVVTAHGQDVANIGRVAGAAAATRYVVGRAATVIAVSDWLRRELEGKVTAAIGKVEVVDCGVDLDRFPVAARRLRLRLRRLVDRPEERAPARERVRAAGRGDADVRRRRAAAPAARGAPRDHRRSAPCRTTRFRRTIAAARVLCAPSLVEPFGQAILEGLATGRPVVATKIGGPPEFVPPEAGVLVDPGSEDEILDGLRRAAALPCPNDAARATAAEHDVRRQAERIEAILERAAGAAPSGSEN